jgi:hypothetical protein
VLVGLFLPIAIRPGIIAERRWTVLVAMHHSSPLSRNKDFRLNQPVPPKFPLRQLDVWGTPHMTAGHTVLAIGFTVYVFIAVRCEERDLACRYGSSYGRWRSSLATRGTSTEPRKAAAV